MKHRYLSAVALAALLVAPASHAALTSYLTLSGETQGEIEGEVDQPGLENSIAVISFEHQVISPRDAASGLPTGRRQHAPIKIVTQIDKSTPKLYQALTANENLTQFQLKFFRPDPTGTVMHFYTIELNNARVSSIRQWKPNILDPSSIQFPDMVEIQLTYGRIIWTYEEGGITAEDDWAAR